MISENSKSDDPADHWTALKAKGHYAKSEIDAIDNATPWKPVEPKWWLEMMEARKDAIDV
jgi:hypothetical protein